MSFLFGWHSKTGRRRGKPASLCGGIPVDYCRYKLHIRVGRGGGGSTQNKLVRKISDAKLLLRKWKDWET